MLTVHRAERADALVAALGRMLARPVADPFAPEIVAVPSRGVERWLAQQLGHVLGAGEVGDGVCANVEFPSHTQLLDEAVAAADADYAAAVEAWDPSRAVWPLLDAIDGCLGEPWAALLAANLKEPGRRFAIAEKLARLFDRYGRSRPELLVDWQRGSSPLPDDLAWQAEVWRRLRAAVGTPAPAELLDAACARLTAGPGFSIFGPTRLSPARITMLGALARTRDVQLWLHHPSPALWRAVSAEQPGARRERRPVARNPLLASMSRDVRELQQLLGAVDHLDEHHPIAARPATVLGRLQQALADDSVDVEPTPADSSLRVHAAHGPARQVEVLREVILGLLERDPSLEPRDIVIMCPDVEMFAPLVAASFGMDEDSGHPAARLRIRFADRALRQTNPLLGLVAQLLELAASRITATQLLDLANGAPTRRRFGFDDDDIEQLRAWTVASGARWGLDPEHRGEYGLRRVAQGTWRAATDRVLLGAAMEDDLAWVRDTLPLDDVDSNDITLAGTLAELLDRVDSAVRSMTGEHTVAEWTRLLHQAVDELGEAEQPWQAIQLRHELDDVAESAEGSSARLGLADVAALLSRQLAGRPTRASFRTGTITVCTLVPMRSVPHRVVCLLGMDDGVFPRQAIPDGDDVLARDPRSGERDPRSEDRQLFLDAVCAAQDHLILTYTGADPRSGIEVPPCVPLGELLDAVDTFLPGGREAVVTHHPLQPFDTRNFEAGQPFSFDPAALAGARASQRPRVAPKRLITAPLGGEPEPGVSLDDLVKFYEHPVRGFLRQRLEIATPFREEDPDDALTVELDGLEEWAIGERMLRDCLAGADAPTTARREWLRGTLPPGPLGGAALGKIGPRISRLLDASAEYRAAHEDSRDVAIDLGAGRVLSGTVPGVRGDTVLTVGYATLAPRHRLTAWIRYLAVVAATGDGSWRAVAVGRRSDDAAVSTFGGVTPDLAREVLRHLMRFRDAGLRAPLPLALATSAEYARRRRSVSVVDALAGAELKWEQDKFRPEREEAEHVLVYGRQAPLAWLTGEAPADGEDYPGEQTRFGALARWVWDPLLTVES